MCFEHFDGLFTMALSSLTGSSTSGAWSACSLKPNIEFHTQKMKITLQELQNHSVVKAMLTEVTVSMDTKPLAVHIRSDCTYQLKCVYLNTSWRTERHRAALGWFRISRSNCKKQRLVKKRQRYASSSELYRFAERHEARDTHQSERFRNLNTPSTLNCRIFWTWLFWKLMIFPLFTTTKFVLMDWALDLCAIRNDAHMPTSPWYRGHAHIASQIAHIQCGTDAVGCQTRNSYLRTHARMHTRIHVRHSSGPIQTNLCPGFSSPDWFSATRLAMECAINQAAYVFVLFDRCLSDSLLLSNVLLGHFSLNDPFLSENAFDDWANDNA